MQRYRKAEILSMPEWGKDADSLIFHTAAGKIINRNGMYTDGARHVKEGESDRNV